MNGRRFFGGRYSRVPGCYVILYYIQSEKGKGSYGNSDFHVQVIIHLQVCMGHSVLRSVM